MNAILARWAIALAATEAPAVWVEIDENTDVQRSRPFVVYTLRAPRSTSSDQVGEEVAQRASRVLGISRDDPRIEALRSILESSASEPAVRHVALRPTANGEILRVICRVLSSEAPDLVPGGHDSSCGRAMSELTSSVLDYPIATNLNLDVGPRASDRCGLEFYFEKPVDEEPRWRRLFDELERRGLLCPTKRLALEAWPTGSRECDVTDEYGQKISRDLMVKVDFDSRGAFQAKAYLVFGPSIQPEW